MANRSDPHPTALTQHRPNNHIENYHNSDGNNKGEDTNFKFWNFFDPISDYSLAFSNSVRILFSNSVAMFKNPDIFIRILDPIVESNRWLFWFLFPEAEDNFASLYDMESSPVTMKQNSSNFALSEPSSSTCNLLTGCPDFDKLPFPASEGIDGFHNPTLGNLTQGGEEGAWWMPLFSVLFISLFPCLLIFFFVSVKRLFNQKSSSAGTLETFPRLLTLSMLAFAAGGLLGDCVLHLFPVIFSVHTPHHDHGCHVHGSLNMTSISFIFGIFFFWTFELAATSAPNPHKHKLSTSKDEPEKQKKRSSRSKSTVRRRTIAEEPTPETDSSSTTVAASTSESAEENYSNQPAATVHSNHGFAVVHVCADLIHNFTDGLALAAAWSTEAGGGRALGLSTTLAILLHEIPHELGDIAALIHLAGWSFPSALRMQLITSAIGSFGGLLFGLLLSKLSSTFNLTSTILPAILPFSAGGFIYLSLAIIFPQLKAECALFTRKRDVLLIAFFALSGVFLLALV